MSPRAGAIRRGLPPATAGVPAPADKRFRRSDPRSAGRRRLGQLVWRLARWTAVVGVTLGGFTWLGTTVLGSPMFQVQRLVVRGHARLSTGDVEALVAGIHGEHIMRVDFDRYRRRLMDSPWVESASMWRVLPSTIEVRIVERSPLAIARVGQQLYLVDAHGVIIDEYGPQHRDFDLPIVDGLVVPANAGGPSVDPARLSLAPGCRRPARRRPGTAAPGRHAFRRAGSGLSRDGPDAARPARRDRLSRSALR
jgi:POTRA domain, FtsQ-type